MPTAALADIHGNVHALDAVLADPRVVAAERIVVLGDAVAAPPPSETFDRLAALGDRVRILRGNADRIVLDGENEEGRWAARQLGADRLAAVAAWPLSFALQVEGLGAVRCCHALPDDDERAFGLESRLRLRFRRRPRGNRRRRRHRWPHARPVRPRRGNVALRQRRKRGKAVRGPSRRLLGAARPRRRAAPDGVRRPGGDRSRAQLRQL